MATVNYHLRLSQHVLRQQRTPSPRYRQHDADELASKIRPDRW